jgi:integrase
LQALRDWLAVRGDAPGALFTRIGKGGKLTHEGLTAQAVYYVFDERAEAAGVAAFSPHDMRRTFAGDMLDAGVDIATVQKLMGHSNVSTTAGYDRRGERAKKDAAKRLHFPYQGSK